MSYRNDLDAMTARAAALDAEVAAKVRERDAAKQLLDEAVGKPMANAPPRRSGRVLEPIALFALGAMLCLGARVVARDWPLSPAQTVVVATPPTAPFAYPAKPIMARPVDDGLPAECYRYKQAVLRLESCDKFPTEARRALREGFDQAEIAWRGLPASAMTQLAEACKAGADAISQSAAATCGN